MECRQYFPFYLRSLPAMITTTKAYSTRFTPWTPRYSKIDFERRKSPDCQNGIYGIELCSRFLKIFCDFIEFCFSPSPHHSISRHIHLRALQRRYLSESSSHRDRPRSELLFYGLKQASPLTLKELIEFGSNDSPFTKLLAAQFLHHELPVR